MAFTLRNNVTVRGSAEGTEGRGRKEEQEQEGGKREISLSLSLSQFLTFFGTRAETHLVHIK